jgi:hypothetical protein
MHQKEIALHSDSNTISKHVTSDRRLLILSAKQPMEDHRGPTSNEKSHMVWCLGEEK